MEQRSAQSRVISFGPFRIDRGRGCLLQGSEIIPLRPKTWETLLFLAENAGMVVSVEALQQAVWPGIAVTPKTLTNVIGEIRRALGDNPDRPLYIETIHRRGYRFLPQSEEPSAPEPEPKLLPASAPTADIIGRADEIHLLLDCWERARANQRQVVFVCGEAGIGKSTLLEALLANLSSTSDPPLIGRGHSIERHGAHEAYMPVLEAISSWAAEAPALVTPLLREFAPTWLTQIPWLVPEAERRSFEGSLFAGSTARMLREGTRFLEALSERRPLVLALEDLHWADPETVDFIAAAGRSRTSAILVIGSYRPIEARIHSHPIATAASALVRAGARQIIVEPFTRSDVTVYLSRRLADDEVAVRAAAVVEEHSRGIPLLVRAVVDHMISQRLRIAGPESWRLPKDPQTLLADLPHSVRDVIETQIALLPAVDLEMLEMASVVGQQFSIALVADALDVPHDTVADRLSHLSRQATLIEERGRVDHRPSDARRTYGFVHTLYQVALYDRLPQSRRQRLHQRIGELIERDGDTSANAAALASHFERSGDHRRAVLYLGEAAYAVSRRAASREAFAYLRRALALVALLPDDRESAELELRLQTAMGEAAAAAFGADSDWVRQAAGRALQLTPRVEDPRTLFSALHALWLFTMLNGDARVGNDLVTQTAALANRTSEPLLMMLADVMMGTIACFAGFPTPGREALERALARLPELRPTLPRTGLDIEVEIRLTLGWAFWLVGCPDKALRSAELAANLATDQQDPNSCTLALVYLFNVHHLRGEHDLACARARELQALGDEFDLDLPKRTGRIMEAAALMEQGRLDEAMVRLLESGATETTAGVQQIVRTYYLGRVALACGRVGAPEQGLVLINEALERIQQNGLATSEAEIRRIQGELVQQLDGRAIAKYGFTPDGDGAALVAAEQCFDRALEIARRQQSRAWELRATTSRARLRQAQGRSEEGLAELAELYSHFSEGHDTADLREARELLDQLRGVATGV